MHPCEPYSARVAVHSGVTCGPARGGPAPRARSHPFQEVGLLGLELVLGDQALVAQAADLADQLGGRGVGGRAPGPHRAADRRPARERSSPAWRASLPPARWRARAPGPPRAPPGASAPGDRLSWADYRARRLDGRGAGLVPSEMMNPETIEGRRAPSSRAGRPTPSSGSPAAPGASWTGTPAATGSPTPSSRCWRCCAAGRRRACLHALGDELGVTRPNVTKLVNGLERGGLVERLPHPSDGRMVQAHLTPQGGRSPRRRCPDATS